MLHAFRDWLNSLASEATLDDCWSCRRPLRTDAISLDNNDHLHVCRACWRRMSVAERVGLQWLFRSRRDGGSGIAEALGEVREICAKQQAYQSPGFPPRDEGDEDARNVWRN